MNLAILIFGLLLLFFYTLGAIIFVPLTNFKFHDYYNDDVFRYGPDRPSWVSPNAFVLDLHCHTTFSDGLLTPRQAVLWHIANGYNGMVVTDHNTLEAVDLCKSAAKEIDPSFLVISGMEFTTMRVHLNLIGISELIPLPRALWTRKRTIIQAIRLAHHQGGVVQFNHRDWYFHHRYLPKQWYFDHGIDGFEEYNGFGFVDDEVASFIRAHKHIRPLYSAGGTDVHDPAKHLRVYTEILTSDHSEAGVISALKQGQTKVYCEIVSEKKRKRPEAGLIQTNPKRAAYIRKWKWFNWIGYALIDGAPRKLILPFYAVAISLIIGLSVML